MSPLAAATLAAAETNDVGMSTPALGDEPEMTATETEVAEAVVGEIVDDAAILQKAIDEATLDGTKPAEMVHIASRTGKGFLTIDPEQTEWTPIQLVQLKALKIETQGADAIPMPFVMHFLYLCQVRDLDPWLKEAYLITHGKRFYSKQDKAWVDKREYTTVIAIDGFRKRGEDTGQYMGQVGPEWCGEDLVWRDGWNPKWGSPTMARVGILRQGNPGPTWGVAAFEEFCPMLPEWSGYGEKRQKTGRMIPAEMWTKMGANQIAKCAEAQGFRKTFPRQMSGLYAEEEFDRAKVEYQQSQEDERQRELAARLHEAREAQQSAAPVVGEVIPNGAPDAQVRAGEPVSVGQAARETVSDLRAAARTPRGETRAPGRAPSGGSAQSSAPLPDQLVWLREEILMLSELHEMPRDDLFKRQIARSGKPLVEFTADELVALVMPMRAPAAAKMRAKGRGAEAAAYETAPAGARPLADLLGRPNAGVEDVDPTKPHAFTNQEGVCRWCEGYDDERIHQV